MAGSALAGLGVAAGAFGAHGLEGRIEADLLAVFETGARYHVIHALALLVVGLVGRIEEVAGRNADRAFEAAAWLFTVGIAVFAGSLYALAVTGHRWLGAVTPVGGACLLAGWAAMAAGALRTRGGASS